MTPLVPRRVSQEDLPFLQSLWSKYFENEDLSIKPENTILDWISTSKNVNSVMLEENGSPIAYLRYETNQPGNIRFMLVKDQAVASTVIQYVHSMTRDEEVIRFPIHPSSRFAKELIKYPFKPNIKAWDAGQIKVFNQENTYILDYIRNVQEEETRIGVVHWNVEFDNC